jgi:CRP-like cAMP-binding protein
MNDTAQQQISLEERKQLLREYELFILLTSEDLTELAQIMQEKTVRKGEVIVSEGDIVDSIIFIATGEAEVIRSEKTIETSTELLLATLRKGASIGLSIRGFFSTDSRRTATVRASTDMVLLTISLSQFYNFMSKPSRLYPALQVASEQKLRVWFLKQSTLFAGLSFEDANNLARKLTQEDFNAGDEIFKIGDVADKCYFIKHGKVETSTTDSASNKKARTVLEFPAFFGESGLQTKGTRDTTAKALEACQLIVLNRRSLEELQKSSSDEKKSFFSKVINKIF